MGANMGGMQLLGEDGEFGVLEGVGRSCFTTGVEGLEEQVLVGVAAEHEVVVVGGFEPRTIRPSFVHMSGTQHKSGKKCLARHFCLAFQETV